MKRVIKKQFVVAGSEAGVCEQHTDVPLPSASGRSSTPPGVRLVRVDGHVQAIEVTCRCGDTSVVEIDYESPPESNEITQ